MKKIFQKFLVIGFFALTQAVFLSAAQAQDTLTMVAHDKNQLSPANGDDYRDVRCSLSGSGGEGFYQKTYNATGRTDFISITNAQKKSGTISGFVPAELLKQNPHYPDVCLEKKIEPSDVAAFPEAESYLRQPGAKLRICAVNLSELPTNLIKTGCLADVCSLEIRCVYIVLNGHIEECIGCYFTFIFGSC